MVSLIAKFKKLYKGSYYYANKKYGKYTKRRPFPNFNDFDCSPSGDFSMNEIPVTSRKVDYDKNNNSNENYFTTNENNVNVTEINNYDTSIPNISDILGIENEKKLYCPSNSVSPVTTVSDDFTMVNPSTTYEASESSFTVTFDGMSDNNKTCPTNDDDVKVTYDSNNNWNVEIKRYYPSLPRNDELDNKPDDYQNQSKAYGTDMDMSLKKKKWWKKVIPHKKGSSKRSRDSTISDNTYYYDRDSNVDDYGYNKKYNYEYNPTRYDSARYSDMCCSDDYNKSYNYSSKYVSRYDEDLTEGVLIVNENVNNTLLY